jgi:hypothetical protein
MTCGNHVGKGLALGLMVVGVVVAAPVAHGAERSFDELLTEAVPVTDLAQLVDPLFDTCPSGDSLEARQCQGARAFLEARVRGKTYVAFGDAASVSVSPYDVAMKQVDIDVQGCLACLRPLKLGDGKGGEAARFVTTKPPRAIKAGKAIGVEVATQQVAMWTAEREQNWRKQEKKIIPRLRTQFIFKLGSAWSSGSFSGVSFVPLAYRVVDVCTGEVITTSPALPKEAKQGKATMPIALASGDNLRCPAPGEDLTAEERAARDELARLPATLSRDAIAQGMASVQERVHDCRVEFEETGTVNVRLVVDGPTGKVKDAQVLPPFDKTPAGLCVKAALKSLRFARTRNDNQEVKLPLYLR